VCRRVYRREYSRMHRHLYNQDTLTGQGEACMCYTLVQVPLQMQMRLARKEVQATAELL